MKKGNVRILGPITIEIHNLIAESSKINKQAGNKAGLDSKRRIGASKSFAMTGDTLISIVRYFQANGNRRLHLKGVLDRFVYWPDVNT